MTIKRKPHARHSQTVAQNSRSEHAIRSANCLEFRHPSLLRLGLELASCIVCPATSRTPHYHAAVVHSHLIAYIAHDQDSMPRRRPFATRAARHSYQRTGHLELPHVVADAYHEGPALPPARSPLRCESRALTARDAM